MPFEQTKIERMYDVELKLKLEEYLSRADGRLLRMLHAVAEEYLDGQEQAPVQTTIVPDEKADMRLCRLVYSSARSSNCTDEDIQKILDISRKNNAKLGITGVLIHTADRFLQVLEGPYEPVMALYNKIKTDPRHGGSVMRFCETVKKRHFAEWNMGHKNVASEALVYETETSAAHQLAYQPYMDGDLSSYEDDGMRALKMFLKFS